MIFVVLCMLLNMNTFAQSWSNTEPEKPSTSFYNDGTFKYSINNDVLTTSSIWLLQGNVTLHITHPYQMYIPLVIFYDGGQMISSYQLINGFEYELLVHGVYKDEGEYENILGLKFY